ncbi:tetratricopeptide repeat protein [Aliarcobacter cryaerophilus]|uniref:tetratricopeptide repeat protein n=1 Tax=Aliarcobacter cryaerophilus TaxID=28198 RepID=UPI0021B53CFA|nr:tetratricopeptide repeat protein [Aliarcobacter cryaerophilus]MCT7481583.1 sel1 repeat family protein [Aliarcobacter cryaerophilus]
MVKKIILGFGIFATLLFGATLQDGLNAFEKGDYKTAFTIFEDLAKKGDVEAQFELGMMYANGEGVRQDFKIAKEWYGKACDGGNQNGCDNYKILNQEGY